MPSLRHFHKAHFAGKELQSGKKMERAIQPEIPLPNAALVEYVVNVTIARSLSDTFAGIRPADVPLFISAQLTGGLAATFPFRWLLPNLSSSANRRVGLPPGRQQRSKRDT